MTPAERFKQIFTEYIKRPGAENLMKWLDSTDFFTAPASTRFHGDYPGGLVEHSVNVWQELCRLLHVYPEIKTTAETAAIISLLHDLCKINMYKPALKRKQVNGVWRSYEGYDIDEDYCFGGHGAKSVYLIQKYIDLSYEEAAAINSHMGQFDATTYSNPSAAYSKFPLAWLLHVADESATYILESKK